jgi:hypothetical protein
MDFTYLNMSFHTKELFTLTEVSVMLGKITGAGNFSLHHRVQNGSGAHPAS